MEKNYDILAFGEALIDFTSVGEGVYQANPGGAPFNLAACAAMGGAKVAFMGKVGNDSFGEQLFAVAKSKGVCTRGLLKDLVRPTTHAFVTVGDNGDNSFIFCRSHCADVAICCEDIDEKLIKSSRHFHFGGLSLAAEPCRSALYKALNIAVEAGCSISFDPNYRPFLWDGGESFVQACRALPVKPDLLKVSESEALLLTGKTQLDEAMEALTEYARAVLLTLGDRGAVFGRGGERVSAAAYPANTKDTTGAGDIFLGSFLSGVAALKKTLGELDCEDIAYLLDKSCEFAAKSTEKQGAIPSIPEISF